MRMKKKMNRQVGAKNEKQRPSEPVRREEVTGRGGMKNRKMAKSEGDLRDRRKRQY